MEIILAILAFAGFVFVIGSILKIPKRKRD